MSLIADAKLTPKQQRFVDEYLIDLNATQAAIRTGYSKKTAGLSGHHNLKSPEVQQAIRAAMRERQERTEVTQDRVLQEYARLAFFDPRKLFHADGSPKPIEALDDDTAAALTGIDVREEYEGAGEERVFVGYTKKYRLANKMGALNSLAKHMGLFDAKHNGEEAQTENGGILMPEGKEDG